MGEKRVPCSNCYATGQVKLQMPWRGWVVSHDGTWEQCNVRWGTGKEKCAVCGGSGYIVEWLPYDP